MRILSILTYYHPHWTGLTAHAQRLAEGLARRGHAVTVLTSRYSPELAPDEVCRGVRVLRLPVLSRVSRGVIMPTFPVAARRLVEAHDVVQFPGSACGSGWCWSTWTSSPASACATAAAATATDGS